MTVIRNGTDILLGGATEWLPADGTGFPPVTALDGDAPINWRDATAEETQFFDEDAAASHSVEGYQNLDNLANIQQWSDDESIFFDAGDDNAAAELWVDLAPVDHAIPDNNPVIAPQEELGDWWDGYDDPVIDTSEWSGAFDATAPPDLDWDWDDANDDDWQLIVDDDDDAINSGPSQALRPDDLWDFDADNVEPIAAPDGYQNADNPPTVLLQPQDPDWDDEPVEEDWIVYSDGDDFSVNPGVPPNTAAVYQDEWDFSADETEQVVGPDGFQNADIAVSPAVQGDIEWLDEDASDAWDERHSDDFDAVGADLPAGSTAAVYQDEWDYGSDETEQLGSPDGFQNADVAAAPASSLAANSDDWDDQDGEDWELIVLDDANFELDPPPADAWDWDADQAPDDDWQILVDDDDDAINLGIQPTSDQHFGDDAEQWDDSTWDSADGHNPDDYARIDVVVASSQFTDDAWDWSDDSDAELVGFEAQTPADVVQASGQPLDDIWAWDEDADDLWHAVNCDDFDPVTSDDRHTIEDGEAWLGEDVSDDWYADQDPQPFVPPPPSQFLDDAWDWTDDSENVSENGLDAVLGFDIRTSGIPCRIRVRNRNVGPDARSRITVFGRTKYVTPQRT